VNHKPLLRVIANAVRTRRTDLGLSQEELAELAGLHRTYVGAIERAERNITVASLVRLAKALNCDVADLVAKT
jgi:transcriptional regulator with XRE-family HTH domain